MKPGEVGAIQIALEGGKPLESVSQTQAVTGKDLSTVAACGQRSLPMVLSVLVMQSS